MNHHQINRFTSNAASTLSHLVSNGLFHQTLVLYKTQIHPHQTLLPSVIKATSSPHFLHFGLQLHCMVLKTGTISDTGIANSLISMYAKCSLAESASQLFDSMPMRDAVTWSSMINCCTQNGFVEKAVEKYKEMCLLGFHPKPELTASVLSVCGRMGWVRFGREVHARVVTNGVMNHSVYLSTALLDMYSRGFDLEAAYRVFECMEERTQVSWTAMIAGCIMNECYRMSLNLFRTMLAEEFQPNRVTLVAILPACTETGSLKHGKEVHGYAIRHQYDSEGQLAATLMEMYCKCGGTLGAVELVFEGSERKDVVMWSSLIGSFSKRGDHANAMKKFNRMRAEGVSPNSITLLAIVSPNSEDRRQAVHGYIVKTGFDSDLYIGNSLIDMYAKCGCLIASRQIFNEIPTRDSVSWSSLIRGYGLHGYSAEALQLFHEMQENKIVPDEISFLAILSACNHGGLIKEGGELFEQMQHNNEMNLTTEHYACYIDLLGRSGDVEDACKVIRDMPVRANPAILSSLVSACKTHGRLDVAKQLVQQLLDCESDNPANYTLSCTIYSEMNDWHGAEEVQRIMRNRGLRKDIGYSRVESDFFC